MPCNDGGPMYYDEPIRPRERQRPSNESKLKKRNDELARENDMLRETILQLVNNPEYKIPGEVVDIVEKAQIEHRKVDLKRLEQVFREARNPEMLGRVLLADPTISLHSQLGFDPDAY